MTFEAPDKRTYTPEEQDAYLRPNAEHLGAIVGSESLAADLLALSRLQWAEKTLEDRAPAFAVIGTIFANVQFANLRAELEAQVQLGKEGNIDG